jgi:hypothetical protein
VITMRRDPGEAADAGPAPAEPRARPDPPTTAEIISSVVAEAVWAPSVHNTQPWRFTADGPRIRLYADVGRQLTAADPDGREMMISCGAALFTARLALRSLGRVPETQVLPDPADPALVAQLSWPRRAAVTEYERRLFGQVRRRRTHRGGFDPVPLSPTLLAALCEGAARDGATLRIVADDGRRAALAAVIETAERALRLDSERVQELVMWSPPPGSPRRDGVPATSYPAKAEHTDPDFAGRDFAHGRGWGLPRLSTAPLFRTAGVAALLTTPGDNAADWVSAGQALQRILLTASTCGVAAALHSQPLEFGWLREFVRTRLSDGGYPQLVLRLGTVIQIATSVRRRPADVLISPGAPADPHPSPA